MFGAAGRPPLPEGVPRSAGEVAHADLRQVFGHQVGGILGPEDLAQLQLLRTLSLLDPKATDIDVPHFPGTFALGDGRGCGSITFSGASQ